MKPYLEKILKDAAKIKYNEVFTQEKKANANLPTDEQCKKFIKQFADIYGLRDDVAFLALTTLFTKGICNKSAPPSMFTKVTNPEDNKELEITKKRVEDIHQIIFENKFIRRLATALAEEICTCAEQHNLEGDLSKRIDKNLQAKGEPRLTAKEKAWANSFCQDLEGLETLSSKRLPQLLAEDYATRFQNKKSSSKKTGTKNLDTTVPKKKVKKTQDKKEISK